MAHMVQKVSCLFMNLFVLLFKCIEYDIFKMSSIVTDKVIVPLRAVVLIQGIAEGRVV